MVDDKRVLCLRDDVFNESVKEQVVSVSALYPGRPRRGVNETVIRSLVSPVEEIVFRIALQTAQCFKRRPRYRPP